MDIDIYQQCPCHQDKKIKFCCGKNVVSDLNEVMSKNRSGQSHAALDQLDRLIAKEGEKDCLMTIKTHIHLSLGEIEQAQAANEIFSAKNPKHTTGLQHKSMIAMTQGRVDDSVSYLQDAMDSITGTELPISLAQAFRLVGIGLLRSGRVLSARAHIKFAQFLKGDQDQELVQLEIETYRLPGISTFLKSEFPLADPPEDSPWHKTYTNVVRATLRGQFRKALKMLQKIDKEHPGERLVKRGLAIVHSIVSDEVTQTVAWREYATMEGNSTWEAIEAAGVAQLLDGNPDTEVLDILRVTLPIDNTDRAFELAESCKILATSQPMAEDPFGEGPAPKHSFLLLSEDQVEKMADLDFDKVPLAVGEVMMFGKQTDRSARIELITVKDENFEILLEKFQSVFEEVCSDDGPDTQLINHIDTGSHVLNWNWMLPQDIDRATHEKLLHDSATAAVSQKWANLKFSDLDGKTLREAAGEPAMVNRVHAKLLVLREYFQSRKLKKCVDALRDELGLDPPPAVDPQAVDFVSCIQHEFLEFDKLDDETLMQVQSQAMTFGNIDAMRLAIEESLKRPELDGIPRDVCYGILARHADSPDEATEHFTNARAEAVKAGRPIGIYLVHEFEYRLANGLTEKLDSLIEVIQSRHMKEPDVAYELTRVLQKFGVIGKQGPGGEEMAAAAAEPAAQEGGIWTPESGGGSADSPPAEEKSKLWIPD